MSFTRVNLGGWSSGATLTSSQMNNLDADHANAVDKSSAGDTISGPITFSGASASCTFAGSATNGMTFANGSKLVCNGTLTLGATCVATTLVGSSITLNGSLITGAAGAIQLNGGSNDYIVYSTTRSFNKVIAPTPLYLSSGWAFQAATTLLAGPATTTSIYLLLPPIHNGGTFSSIGVEFITATHSNLPTNFPSFDLRRKKVVDGALSDVSLFAGGTQYYPNPGSVSAYNNSGNVQHWSAVPNQNNVIDTTQYFYYLVLTDENGANALAGNTYVGVTFNISGIANNAPA